MTNEELEATLNDPHYKRFARLMQRLAEQDAKLEKLEQIQGELNEIKETTDNTFRIVLFAAVTTLAVFVVEKWF